MKSAVGFERLDDFFVDRRKRYAAHAPLREQALSRGRCFNNRGRVVARVPYDPSVGFENVYHWPLKGLQEPAITAQKRTGYVDG